MKHFLLLLATLIFIAGRAGGQTGDLGAQIAAADARLGKNPGQIIVSVSGTISEGEVSLSDGHDLVCINQTTISLNAGSYLYQNSHTHIQNCIISSTPTPISGEVQSLNTDHVSLENVTFMGGGNLVYWNGIKDFLIANNKVTSITAADVATQTTTAGYYLVNCSRGQVENLVVSGFVFPPGLNNTAIFELNHSDHIEVHNPVIQNVDASYVRLGAGAIEINGSSNIVVSGGQITGNPNADGILSESDGDNIPSSYLSIIGVNSSNNGGAGLNAAAPLGLGDGLDLINTSHIYISHCTLDSDGSLHDEQPGIWLFLDDDVVLADSDVSNGSMAGVAAAGSPNVRLVRDTINRNQATGVFTEWQGGTATNVGAAVSWAGGVSGGFGLSWLPGTPFILDAVTYRIASVTDAKHLNLATAPPDHSSPVTWGVNTTQQIRDSVIDDNGRGGFGGQTQVGISWADGTTGIISGVTSANTGTGSQLYGLELANTANVTLDNDNFSGNMDGGNGILAGLLTTSKSALSFPAQGLSTASPPQTVMLIAGAVAVENLLIQVSGDFAETNNCGVGLPAFATCQVQLTFSPTSTGTLSGALTIAAAAPNDPPTISLSGTGVSPSVGLSITSGTSTSATVAAGTTAKYSLSIGGNGISGVALLTCGGAPLGATCNLPATEAISATQPTVFAVSVTTSGAAIAAQHPTHSAPEPWLWAFTLVGWVVLPAGGSTTRSVRRRLHWLLLPMMFLCSCGRSPQRSLGNQVNGTVAGMYTLTVTANVGNTSAQLPLTLTVQ